MLSPAELTEEAAPNKQVSVIVTTTTLSAGVNIRSTGRIN
jgi:replicative superfamily II helicase